MTIRKSSRLSIRRRFRSSVLQREQRMVATQSVVRRQEGPVDMKIEGQIGGRFFGRYSNRPECVIGRVAAYRRPLSSPTLGARQAGRWRREAR